MGKGVVDAEGLADAIGIEIREVGCQRGQNLSPRSYHILLVPALVGGEALGDAQFASVRVLSIKVDEGLDGGGDSLLPNNLMQGTLSDLTNEVGI